MKESKNKIVSTRATEARAGCARQKILYILYMKGVDSYEKTERAIRGKIETF